MRGLIFLFLAIVFFGITWRYVNPSDKGVIKQFIRSNFWIVAVAVLAVAIAVFFSTNVTLRLV